VDKAAIYRIKVRGMVPESWHERLGGLQISNKTEDGVTLEGRLPDQSALAGVLDTLFSLHLSLLEVNCLEEE
jgi:hypothetical protein